jgi:site-specific DNA-methyltransferase (adenine-specific)
VLHAEFGFVLDPAASSANHKTPAWYGLDHPDPARRDGRTADWSVEACTLGGSVWLNPPYGRAMPPWIEKAALTARAGVTVVALLPARTDTAAFHRWVFRPAVELRFLRGRLRFGDAVAGAPFPSVVVVYRARAPPLLLPSRHPFPRDQELVMPFLPALLGSPDDDGNHLPRYVRAELAHVEAQGAVAFHRLSNTMMVSRVGMIELCSLTRLQAELEASCPAASGRLNLIGDVATGVVATEIARLVAP